MARWQVALALIFGYIIAAATPYNSNGVQRTLPLCVRASESPHPISASESPHPRLPSPRIVSASESPELAASGSSPTPRRARAPLHFKSA